MSSQIILSALNSKLESVNESIEKYKKEVLDPAMSAKTKEVLDWFKENVSTVVPNVVVGEGRIEIPRYESSNYGWGGITISLETNWESDNNDKYVEMSWYGSRAKVSDENKLLDVQVFGAVASKLHVIEYEFINNWRPSIIEIQRPYQNLTNEVYSIQQSIRKVESDIFAEVLESYKKLGFECTLTKKLELVRNWEDDGIAYKIKEEDPYIKLQTGRSKYDYAVPKYFKILKTNKYKTTLSVILRDDRSREYEVTANQFNNYISEVYEWQTSKAKKYNDDTNERFAKLTKVEA